MSVIHLTANSRLSQTLKQSLFAQQMNTVAETPQIMTLQQWWQQWEQACLLCGEFDLNAQPKKVLSAFEAQLIWETILEAESQKRLDENGQPLDLLNLSSTAKQLYQAWTYWMGWLNDEQRAAMADQHLDAEEVALFKIALQRYQAELDKHHWQDAVLHQEQSLQWLAEGKGRSRLPSRFELHGFDEITPFIKRWQACLESFGCEVVEHETVALQQPETLAVYKALDQQDEVQQVALWAVKQWLERQQTQAPHTIKIGVIAPNLSDYKAPLTRALNEQLALLQQQHLPLHNSATESLFNVSLGVSLTEVPLVQNALLTLKLFCQPKRSCSYNDWSNWLISPYTQGDWVTRQKADSKLRAKQWTNFKWPTLLASDISDSLPDKLKKILMDWQPIIETRSANKLSVSAFVGLVADCLKTLGWCSSRTLSSDEHQQQQAWFKTLEQFAGLTETQGKQTFAHWLTVLQRFVSEAVHQSQSKGLQPIQVMGMLEAGGQQFDALWVMGLSDEAWPRVPNPNPFLPMLLQRTHKMPRCDAQKELLYAQQVTERLSASAAQQVWSYASQQGEAEMLISPLLETERFKNALIYQRQPYQTLAQASFQKRRELEWVLDNRGPEIPIDNQNPVKAPGGTGILQAQSQCPLMAFIDYRLGARNNLKTVEDGLQQTNQGTLIHKVLEHFWLEFKTQSKLFTLSDDELHEALKKHISEQFAGLESAFEAHYLSLEQARIFELLCQWMELEKKRPAFSVSGTEQEQMIVLAGIEFKVVVDRIDLVEGKKVILDYKTGKASVNNLLKTPIKAPQLAVYLFTSEDEVGGLGYGLLHSDDGVKISAIAEDESVFDAKYGDKLFSISAFSKLSEKEGGDFYEVEWRDFLGSLCQEVLDLAASIQQGVADMTFDKPIDIAYAAGHLALRLPEVNRQLAEAGLVQEEEA
ncbi:MAG: PD-(D/E)XK nuclease family protein [Thiotrichales bacterium]|nr:PD-(D/E)XK nuclease family protein [Thiotrichales bacterium]